jgi:exodeoxyribonuclease VII large subunit
MLIFLVLFNSIPDIWGNFFLTKHAFTVQYCNMEDELFQEKPISEKWESKKVAEITDYIKWVMTQKKYDEVNSLLTLSSHKSVAVRRLLAQAVAQIGEEVVIPNLEEWKNQESDRKTWVLIELAIDRIQRRKNGDESTVHSLSVSEALTMIRGMIAEKTYTIEGEISESNIYGQMYYFTIKDLNDATLGCSAFANTIYRAGFPLNTGLSIRVTGKFKINQKSIRLFFDVQSMELTGEGELMRNLKLLEEKLTNEGVIDPTRKRIPKTLPENILLFASPNSAALTDYIKVINQRRSGLKIYHYPIKTQGVGVEEEMITAFEASKELVERHNIDTIIITRGGGSKEDLMAFNSEKVVRSIHALARPTIVAIGHERDTTLAELVADIRASTPSQAAEFSSRSKYEVGHEIQTIMQTISLFVQEKKYAYLKVSEQIIFVLSTKVQREIAVLRNQSKQIDHTISSSFQQMRLSNREIIHRLESGILSQIQYQKTQIRWNIEGIITNFRKEIALNRTQLELVSTKIQMEHPKTILEKGYAIVGKGKKTIGSSKELIVGDVVTLGFIDGERESVIK